MPTSTHPEHSSHGEPHISPHSRVTLAGVIQRVVSAHYPLGKNQRKFRLANTLFQRLKARQQSEDDRSQRLWQAHKERAYQLSK